MSTETAHRVLQQKTENILILDKEDRELASAILKIVDQLPSVEITRADSLATYKDIISKDNFDIVVLDYDISGDQGINLIHQLKLKDYEPAVLIVSQNIESKIFTDIYNYGCHRYIVKNDRWKEEIGPAVRHLLRIRKLESENRSLLAKLTEANALLGEKNRRLDEFSATLAHDIRGPLGGICMKLEYVLDTYGDKFDDKLKGLLDRARQSSERLTHVVQGVYDFAKLGSKGAKMGHIDLNKLVREVVLDLSCDDSVNVTVGISDLPNIWGSTELIRRVLINLISNAVKYNDKEEVIINIGLRNIEVKNLGRFAEIFIEDNGPGIAEDRQKEVFQIFTRGVAPQHAKEGLGLGLSVVQRIVEMHYGKVWIESDEKKGTTFVMSLPMDDLCFAK